MEIATQIVDKLQEENRILLNTLHKAQDKNKYQEKQLAEKDRLIKVLEERIRAGTDGILEMASRQKELTIRHLEAQIKKLISENEDLEVRLDAVKAEICPKCESKLLLKENVAKTAISKSLKASGNLGSVFHRKKSSGPVCSNQVKSLEKIVEHKDKRIINLSKEVTRLKEIENELTLKVRRLTKLLPMSRLPPQAITECLLQEIQILESQVNGNDSYKHSLTDVLNEHKKNIGSASQECVSKSSRSSERYKTSSVPNVKFSTANLYQSKQSVSDVNENEVLLRKLQKLCNDINELKRLFAFESDKLSSCLNASANEYHTFKTQLEEMIDNLNDIVQKILTKDFDVLRENISKGTAPKSDDSFVISCLQQRLQESLTIIAEIENENKALKEELAKVKSQESYPRTPLDYCSRSDDKITKSSSASKEMSNDVKELHKIIKTQSKKLEAAEKHIDNCQNFIVELQNNTKFMNFDSSKMQFSPNIDRTTTSKLEQQNKFLQTQLDVAEKNIKTCENIIEKLQNTVKCLEEENVKLESELVQVKGKAICAENTTLCSKISETHVSNVKKLNQDLQDKVKSLEEANKKLIETSKNVSTKNIDDQKTLLNKLSAAEKQICTLEKSIETLQGKLKTAENDKEKLSDNLKALEEEKSNLEAQLEEERLKEKAAVAYEDDVMALKNALILKEDENKQLNEALRELENKTLEMNRYRKSLHQEIENLCKALMENDEGEDSERRKEIYKAAVLRSAQALLGLDGNYNFKSNDSNSALDEFKHQVRIYLTEVSRIHELITIKEQARDHDLLMDYLDLPDDTLLKPSSSRQHESHVQGGPTNDDLQAYPNLNTSKPLDLRINEKTSDLRSSSDSSSASSMAFKTLQEELAATKSVTNYLLSSCSRLEDSLSRERVEKAHFSIELEVSKETIKELKAQLDMKEDMSKRLNYLIEMMRSKEFNDEITLEHLKNEIKWLVDENQKVLEKVTVTQSELSKCREENCRIQNDLASVKRQLLSEKYENAKVNNELKRLRIQLSNSCSTFND